jgi:hypothetical protein
MEEAKMTAKALRVHVRGPLAEFAPGFAEDLGRLGYADLSARDLLQVMAHLSCWLGTEGLVPGCGSCSSAST